MTRLPLAAALCRGAVASLLCAGAALAQGQAPVPAAEPAPTAQRVRPMTPENTSVTAFFYRQPVLLDREKHKALRLQPADARFAAANQAVPLVLPEFPEACLEYPIAFAKGGDGQWLALALTGLQAGTNAFVNDKGQWLARYVPASVRRYPFILAEGGKDQLNLAVDMAAPHLGKEGEALFDDKGEPSEFVRKLLPLLADFQAQALRTSAFVKQLEEAGLLAQQNLQVRLGDQRNAVVEGLWIIDEAKLRELPAEKVLAWFKGGEMTAVHAHMLSLRNLVPLLERSAVAGDAKAAASPKPAPAAKPGRKTEGRKAASAS